MSATGAPIPATSSPPSAADSPATPSGEPERLAPPVGNPKDLRGIDPCRYLSPSQLAELGITRPGKKTTTAWGEQGCRLSQPLWSVGLSAETKLGLGLAQAYRSRDFFENFEETSVAGHPAVRVNSATQLCGVIVGVSDEQTLHLNFGRKSSRAPVDPCAFTEELAGMVLENLPDA